MSYDVLKNRRQLVILIFLFWMHSYFAFKRRVIANKMVRQMQLEHCIKEWRPEKRAPVGLKKERSLGPLAKVYRKTNQGKTLDLLISANATNNKFKVEKHVYGAQISQKHLLKTCFSTNLSILRHG